MASCLEPEPQREDGDVGIALRAWWRCATKRETMVYRHFDQNGYRQAD